MTDAAFERLTFADHPQGLIFICDHASNALPASYGTLGLESEAFATHIACDIGCHLFSINPPFNLGATTMGYGLGASSAAALQVKAKKPPIV